MCLCPVQNHPRSFRFFSTMNLSAAHHQISLSDGNNIPLIGLGTYSDPRPVPGKTYVAVKTAIDEGYRHIDGAYVYHNEHEVGEAIREKIAEGKVKREEIFYCGKLWNTEHVPSMVLPALERTLKALKLDYIDLYIIELPMAFKGPSQLAPNVGHTTLREAFCTIIEIFVKIQRSKLLRSTALHMGRIQREST
ncbi:aldo-keto reductase family 1 member D1 isoform X6 [Mus musculus]|uniref:aldo-keto reductase family 1 member D1 isoform X6 n=1 Tax=Mus musculus TaxID=10090 RepID=UPI0005AB9DA6|nr:aldo-keto reductase family 1 member D1 isoform X6 [Mus musculus]|eukprot:XP_011239571.1 PREDICTED: 3-oxo-5-beta-steroid 4-dehydrogenase isoform X6 [Mus musculus]